VLDRRVLVDVAGHAERRELAHFRRVGDRAAEDDDGWTVRPELVEVAHHLHALTLGEPKVERDQIDAIEVALDQSQQLGPVSHRQRLVTRLRERSPEPVAHEGRVVGDDDGVHGRDNCRACHTSSIGAGARRR
jgi:hypothetical protein